MSHNIKRTTVEVVSLKDIAYICRHCSYVCENMLTVPDENNQYCTLFGHEHLLTLDEDFENRPKRSENCLSKTGDQELVQEDELIGNVYVTRGKSYRKLVAKNDDGHYETDIYMTLKCIDENRVPVKGYSHSIQGINELVSDGEWTFVKRVYANQDEK
jgi:hypothetical protein